MESKCCLSVGMEGIGILVIKCCPKLNMSILLPQFQTPPCHTVRLVDFLANEEIAQARNGYIVVGVEGNYSEFI